MLRTIENEFLSATIDETGAQLMSLKSKENGGEYLWQGDSRYWADRAILLFPICGRLFGGKYTYRGQDYEMTIHGFIRRAHLAVSRMTGDSVTFTLSTNEETLAEYPFRFMYQITFSLCGRRLDTSIRVTNTGTEVLSFAVGGHPGFNVPLDEGLSFSDYYLEFGEEAPVKKLILSDTCFMTPGTEPWKLENGKIYRLHHDMFDNDAIFVTDMADSVTLKSDKGSRSVTVSYPNTPYLGFWHKPKTDAPYLCIEPWHGLPSDDGKIDDLDSKHDMVRLPAGLFWETSFSIEIR
ncbi:MAG: aldose 1-epimerase family protein [Clostridia bacterium]|nr:aldose 1-epimerase family protein [Clostridia bacterium]